MAQKGKRGDGTGSVVQRSDGRWMARAMIQGKRHTLYGKTEDEAEAKLRALLVEADRGILPPVEKLTLAALLERWLEDIVRPRVRPSTYRNYSQNARLYILPVLGTKKLTQLQPAHLQALYGSLTVRGLAPSTVHRVHAVLRSSLRYALDMGLVARNVASAAHPPTVRHDEMKVLDREQARALIAGAKGTRWEALLTLAIATGMRAGELLGLRWGDVDLDAATVRVVRQLGKDGVFSKPKTRQSRRTIDLNPSTVKVLREHKARQNEDRLIQGPGWDGQDLVFCTYAGRPLNYRNVTRAFKLQLARAGLPEIRFHDLRHTAATMALLGGVPVKVVSERLGHASVVLTLGTYSHVLPTMGKDAADKLEALLG